MKTPLITLGLLTIALTAAAYEVPSPLAVRFQPEAHQLGNYSTLDDFVHEYNYSYLTYIQSDEPSTVCGVSTWDLVDVYWSHFGWLWFMSHSRSTSFDTESYEPTTAGRDARDDAYDLLAAQFPGKVFKGEHKSDDPTPLLEYYTIEVSKDFVADNLHAGQSDNMHVFHAGCDGWGLKDSYLSAGVRAFVSFDEVLLNTVMMSWTSKVYTRAKSPSVKTIGAAANGIFDHLKVSDPVGTVLAPRIASVALSGGAPLGAGQEFDSEILVDVTFDASMRQSTSWTDIIHATGALRVREMRWVSPTLLRFEVYGAYLGPGQIILDSYNPGMFELDGLMSSSGIGLDGNLDPHENESGVPPNCDDYVFTLTSRMGGDNPASSVAGFTAVSDSGGVRVRWTSYCEIGTAKYLVERGPTLIGPFTVVAEQTAVGPSAYASFLSASSDSGYRILEVETDGDTLFQASDWLQDPFTIEADTELGSTDEDILRAQLESSYPFEPESVPEECDYLIVAPNAWLGDAQTLATFWGQPPRNVRAWAVSLQGIGGPGAIKSYIEALRPRIRYVLLMSDANDYQDLDGTLLWTDVSKWTAAGLSPLGWPAQSSLNVIPMSYQIEGVTAGQGMARMTPWWGSDWGYVDFNGDGLPEISIGRAPVRSSAEAVAFVKKTINAATMSTNTSFVNYVDLWEYGWDSGGRSGALVVSLAEQLRNDLPYPLFVQTLLHDQAHALYPSQLHSFPSTRLNQGRSLVCVMSTEGFPHSLGSFMDLTHGFAMTELTANPSRLPFLLGATCHIGAFDMTENPTVGRALVERFLKEQDRGFWGAFAPNRGSWVNGDYVIASEFLRQVYTRGASSAGEAARMVVENVATVHPEWGTLARSFVFLGDPVVRIPYMRYVVGVGEERAATLRLSAPNPNPTRGRVTTQLSLPVASDVDAAVFDLQGRRIATLAQGHFQAGVHNLIWDSSKSGRPSGGGVYFVRVKAAGKTWQQRVVVLH